MSLTDSSGRSIAINGQKTPTDTGGYFVSYVGSPHTDAQLRDPLTVTTHGGQIAGQVFQGTLTASVSTYNSRSFVYLTPVTTLVAAYARAHPGNASRAAVQRVAHFLGLSTRQVNSPSTLLASAFSPRAFLTAAEHAGGFDRYVTSLVAAMSNPAARHLFRSPPTNDLPIPDSVVEAVEARIKAALLDKACGGAAGQAIEDIVAELGQCAQDVDPSQILDELTTIQQQIDVVEAQLGSIAAGITELNWENVFESQNLTYIEDNINNGFADLKGLALDAPKLNGFSAASCPASLIPPPPPAPAICSDIYAKEQNLQTVASTFESDSYVIYDGLTDSVPPNSPSLPFSSTFAGAEEAVLGHSASLMPPYPAPIFSTVQLAQVLTDMAALQAQQFDIIVSFNYASNPMICPPVQLLQPPTQQPVNPCDWEYTLEYYEAQEQEPRYTVQPLPSDLLVDTSTSSGLIWNAYPVQLCNEVLRSDCPNSIPDADPNFSFTYWDFTANYQNNPAYQACFQETQQDLGINPATSGLQLAFWTAVPGSCIQYTYAKPMPVWSNLGAPPLYPGEFPPYAPDNSPIFLGTQGQVSQLVQEAANSGQTATNFLIAEGFQLVAGSQTWSRLAVPEPSPYYENMNSNSPQQTDCTLASQVQSQQMDSGGTCFGPSYGLQAAFPPPNAHFWISPQDFNGPPPPPIVSAG